MSAPHGHWLAASWSDMPTQQGRVVLRAALLAGGRAGGRARRQQLPTRTRPAAAAAAWGGERRGRGRRRVPGASRQQAAAIGAWAAASGATRAAHSVGVPASPRCHRRTPAAPPHVATHLEDAEEQDDGQADEQRADVACRCWWRRGRGGLAGQAPSCRRAAGEGSGHTRVPGGRVAMAGGGGGGRPLALPRQLAGWLAALLRAPARSSVPSHMSNRFHMPRQ